MQLRCGTRLYWSASRPSISCGSRTSLTVYGLADRVALILRWPGSGPPHRTKRCGSVGLRTLTALFDPTRLICPPGKTLCVVVLLASRARGSLTLPRSCVSRNMGARRSLEKLCAISSVGCTTRIGGIVRNMIPDHIKDHLGLADLRTGHYDDIPVPGVADSVHNPALIVGPCRMPLASFCTSFRRQPPFLVGPLGDV